MPIPAYIICADTMVDDKRTNKISLFNVFDKVTVVRKATDTTTTSTVELKPGDPVPQMPLNAVLISTWLKEDADKGVAFDNQLIILSPSQKKFILDLPPIVMADDGKAFQRTVMEFDSIPPLFEEGVWYYEVRIRKAGDEGDWLTQRLPFTVEFKAVAQPSTNS